MVSEAAVALEVGPVAPEAMEAVQVVVVPVVAEVPGPVAMEDPVPVVALEDTVDLVPEAAEEMVVAQAMAVARAMAVALEDMVDLVPEAVVQETEVTEDRVE